MLIGAIFELILGNTFPAVTFASFSAFWFTFASTLVPSFDACKFFYPLEKRPYWLRFDLR